MIGFITGHILNQTSISCISSIAQAKTGKHHPVPSPGPYPSRAVPREGPCPSHARDPVRPCHPEPAKGMKIAAPKLSFFQAFCISDLDSVRWRRFPTPIYWQFKQEGLRRRGGGGRRSRERRGKMGIQEKGKR